MSDVGAPGGPRKVITRLDSHIKYMGTPAGPARESERSTASSDTLGGTHPHRRCPGRHVEYGGRACTLSAGRTPNPNSPAVVEVVHMYFVWGHRHVPPGRLGSGSRRPIACTPGLHTQQAAPSTSRGGLCRRRCPTKPYFFRRPRGGPHTFCMGGSPGGRALNLNYKVGSGLRVGSSLGYGVWWSPVHLNL